MIDKDSVNNFFSKRSSNIVNNKFCALASRGTNNSFAFSNLSLLISNYIKQSIKNNSTTDPKFLLIPVEVASADQSTILRVYNYMYPGTAILRTQKENLKMKLIFTEW
jgi:hypothetical protein